MIIRELYMKNFGRFSGKQLELEPGINIICGGNEAGKSTAARFVERMFYGMKKGRGRAAGKDDFNRLRPWEGGMPEGSISFSCQGRRFRLNREFPDRAELFCLDDGEVLDVEQGDLDMLLGGLSEGLYQSTVCAGNGQTAVAANLREALDLYLLNMENVREEPADVPAAEKYLKEKQKRAESEYRMLVRVRKEQTEERRQRIAYLAEAEQGLSGKIRALEEEERIFRERQAAREKQECEWQEPIQKKSGGGKKTERTLLRMTLRVTALISALAAAVFFLLDHPGMAAALLVMACILAAAGILGNFGVGGRTADNGSDSVDNTEAKREDCGKTTIEQEAASAERKRLEFRLRREHLEEERKERIRERENCLEELSELESPGEEERRKQLEMEACKDAAFRIRAAAQELAGSWGRRLEQEASDILEAITRGRYRGLKLGAAGEITVTDNQRILVPEQLSTGTREQIWTAVRLAAAQLLSEEEIPFLFDDAFLSWDEERLSVLLEWLAKSGRQTLLFTGGNREERLLRRNSLPYHKIILDENKESGVWYGRYDNSIL